MCNNTKIMIYNINITAWFYQRIFVPSPSLKPQKSPLLFSLIPLCMKFFDIDLKVPLKISYIYYFVTGRYINVSIDLIKPKFSVFSKNHMNNKCQYHLELKGHLTTNIIFWEQDINQSTLQTVPSFYALLLVYRHCYSLLIMGAPGNHNKKTHKLAVILNYKGHTNFSLSFQNGLFCFVLISKLLHGPFTPQYCNFDLCPQPVEKEFTIEAKGL